MNGQLEQSEERYYAIERLAQLQGQIIQLVQGMVIQRARVEKYRQEDLTAARESYSELQQVRRQLCHSISEAQPLLMETEEYRTAATAEKLRIGLSGFDLMSNIYRPVYDAITAFAQAFPVNRTTNAATVGRLMNHIRMGYYPTDPENISLILRGIRFPDGVITNLLDPCCGCGKALRQIAQGNGCYTYGMELDESRAEEAQTRLHRVGFGSFFHSAVSHEASHLLFLNPPYLSVLNESGSRARHEKRFLIESLSCLTYGGLLIYIIP